MGGEPGNPKTKDFRLKVYGEVDKAFTIDFDESRGSYEGFTVVASGADNMRIREPFPYMHLPVQYKGLEFEINCYGRFAGVEMIRPDAFQHFLNISG